MTIDIDIDEARALKKHIETWRNHELFPEFYADLKAAIDNYDEAAHDRENEAYYGGDGAGQKQASATAAACKDAGRSTFGPGQ